MLEDESAVPEPGSRVRRSIFLSEDLEGALARLAEARGTTVNDLIADILAREVARLEGENRYRSG